MKFWSQALLIVIDFEMKIYVIDKNKKSFS